MGQRFKEITLWDKTIVIYGMAADWRKIWKCYRNAKATAVDFDQLLEMVAVGFQNANPIFDSNPQDMHESVLHVIAKHPNICKHICQFNQEAIEF
jgi:tRNA-2-methylthio-N6-dimethylallyladenosine synthase